ncbi:unnamed protein product [Symbiodinium natans]|uniref:AAA+ ATPase domain-containing protein n=1 Tax=Symbiodinium natans TaxID=878477 RepID=A0A812L7W6_9DINO|nr:unnamed protein product [Symbiodinium natans]
MRQKEQAKKAQEEKEAQEKAAQERKAQEEKEAQERKAQEEKKKAKEKKAQEEKEAQERKAQEEKEAQERKAQEEKEAQERKAQEEKEAQEKEDERRDTVQLLLGLLAAPSGGRPPLRGFGVVGAFEGNDFHTICGKGWETKGVSPQEIRAFCVWRAPMFFVSCNGRLLDAYQPMEKEARAVAFTAWEGHAFFYKNARSVYQCDDADRLCPKSRAERRESAVPEFSEWREWDGQLRPGHFWTADLRAARGQLMAQGHSPKVAMRSLCEWSRLRLRAGDEGDCVICELPEEHGALRAWMERLGLKYRGQRLAAAATEALMHLLKAQRELPQQREQILQAQGGLCNLCGAPVALGTCEFDHVVPVHQAFRGQIQEFQALCLECHRLKTSLENMQATTLESRVSRRVYEAYVQSPRLPPLVCALQKWFPLPVFCPLDSLQEASEGHLADLTYVRLRRDGRMALLNRLPYVGEGWYAKPAAAYMLEAGITTWGDFVWSLDATAHVEQRCLAWALEKMERAWDEEHMAKLAVNALIGLWARNVDITFVDAAGDHVFVSQLFSNASHRPAWDFVMAAEYCAVARIRQHLAEVPPRYLKFLKTDCLGFQDLPKKFWPAVERLALLKHPDGTPVYRVSEVEQLRGHHTDPEIQAWMPAAASWEWVEDPVAHCLQGKSLLLQGLPGTGKTHLARRIVQRLREAGDVVQLVSKTHSSAQNLGMGAQTADHWVRRTVRNGRCRLDWLCVEEVTQLDAGLWADVACVAMDKSARFLLMGDFRQLRAVMDSFAGARVERRLKDSDLLRDLAAGYYHELSENQRSDERIFRFIGWLRVGEPEEVPLAEAIRVARREFPRRPGEHPDVCLVISHAHRVQINERENRRLAPPDAVLIARLPGLVGAGGKVPRGVFVTVAEVGAEKVTLDGGQQFSHAELLRQTRLCHAITDASCQGLTLRGHVWLCDAGTQHFNLRHLYVGASRATSSELLAVL